LALEDGKPDCQDAPEHELPHGDRDRERSRVDELREDRSGARLAEFCL